MEIEYRDHTGIIQTNNLRAFIMDSLDGASYAQGTIEDMQTTMAQVCIGLAGLIEALVDLGTIDAKDLEQIFKNMNIPSTEIIKISGD